MRAIIIAATFGLLIGSRSTAAQPFDSPLILPAQRSAEGSLSPFDAAHGDPDLVEGWKDERLAQDRTPNKAHVEAMRHLHLGQENLRSERWDVAEPEFRAAAKLDPLLELAHYGLGQVAMATKRYPEALTAYLNCREAFRTLVALGQTNRMDNEKRLMDQIQDLQDQRRMLESGRVKVLDLSAMMQRVDMMIRELQSRRYQTADAPPPIPTWISVALGSAYFRNGAMADAEREYRAALAVEPKLGEAHNNLAVVCMLSGRYPEAEEEIKAAEKAGFKINPQLKEDLKKASARR
jgi:tetratricopeptide (TPR) repeat protein